MECNLYKKIDNTQFKPIKFSLYNKIDDEYIPQQWGKINNTIYSVDDFEYYSIDLDKKERFLITMYNKEMRACIQELIDAVKNKKIYINVDYDNGSINIIKLKGEEI